MGARQNHQKLFAAVAGDDVDVTHALSCDLGDRADDVVAEHTRACIVVRLQVIDVDEGARQRVVVAFGTFEFLGQPGVKVAVVVETSELVVDAHLLQLLARSRDMVVQALDAQHGLDPRDQLLLFEGFAHIVVGTDLEPLDAAGAVGLHRHQDDR